MLRDPTQPMITIANLGGVASAQYALSAELNLSYIAGRLGEEASVVTVEHYLSHRGPHIRKFEFPVSM